MKKCEYCEGQEDISNKIYEDGSKFSDYNVKVRIGKNLYGNCLVVSPVEYHNGNKEQYMNYSFPINFCPMCGRNLNKKDRKEYMKKYQREYYLKHKNPNAKKYEHKTEEQKKEYHREAQKKHYKKYADKVKGKRMERYYNTEILKNIKKNKQEVIDGEICYHVTNKTVNKILKSNIPHAIICYKKKLYITFK